MQKVLPMSLSRIWQNNLCVLVINAAGDSRVVFYRSYDF